MDLLPVRVELSPAHALKRSRSKNCLRPASLGQLSQHPCADPPSPPCPEAGKNFAAHIRKLVAQGFKPKDAVEIFLQEVMLEHRNEPKVLEQARTAGDDFLRRVRNGLL